jgi:hypothetical protein
MTPRCIGIPISWLRLEQYRIDELPRAVRADVERHLAACSVCAGCLALAQRSSDAQVSAAPAAHGPTRRAWRPRWPLLLSASAAALLAGLLAGLLLFLRAPPPRPASTPAARITVKGGELAIELVRDRNGQQLDDPRRFLPDDRFRVRMTCPPGASSAWDVVIFQDGGTYFPLECAPVPCGNRVALPGAFRLTTAATATVCLVLDPPERTLLRSATPASLPANRACLRLDPQ